jgi:hypothetical protein
MDGAQGAIGDVCKLWLRLLNLVVQGKFAPDHSVIPALNVDACGLNLAFRPRFRSGKSHSLFLELRAWIRESNPRSRLGRPPHSMQPQGSTSRPTTVECPAMLQWPRHEVREHQELFAEAPTCLHTPWSDTISQRTRVRATSISQRKTKKRRTHTRAVRMPSNTLRCQLSFIICLYTNGHRFCAGNGRRRNCGDLPQDSRAVRARCTNLRALRGVQVASPP